MATYKIKDNDFVDPFVAKTAKEAAQMALKFLGFSFGAREDIKKKGPEQTLKDLDFELEVV